MTDKELNMAILDQLYVIADAVWAKMEKVYEGRLVYSGLH